jgi:hypothetical protein
MKPLSRSLASAVVIAVAVTGATVVRADDDGFKSQRNAYVVNKLVSDQNGVASFQDPVLRNAWGVTFTPGASPFWIADNASGCSTLYDGTGVKVALQVPIPLPDNSAPSSLPTGVRPNKSAASDTRGSDRDRLEPHNYIPGPRHEHRRLVHFCHRGRNDFSLGEWRDAD